MSEDLVVGDLGPVAQALAEAAEGFSAMSGNPPTVPDAGPSTAAVDEVLVSLARAMATVTQSASTAADAVQASGRGYTDTDRASGESVPAIDGGAR